MAVDERVRNGRIKESFEIGQFLEVMVAFRLVEVVRMKEHHIEGGGLESMALM